VEDAVRPVEGRYSNVAVPGCQAVHVALAPFIFQVGDPSAASSQLEDGRSLVLCCAYPRLRKREGHGEAEATHGDEGPLGGDGNKTRAIHQAPNKDVRTEPACGVGTYT
jgi:hypothetical protein